MQVSVMKRSLLLTLGLSAATLAYADSTEGLQPAGDNVSVEKNASSAIQAQGTKKFGWQPLKATFNVQSDMLLSTEEKTKRQWFGNSYVTAILQNNFLEARVRFEELSRPLPGNEANQGRGIPYIGLTGRYGSLVDLSVGDFYEQFGSGIMLRSYEERNLGIDNSIRGARVTTRPIEGVSIKALAGQQRNYFDRTMKFFSSDRGYLSAFDLELGLDKWIKPMQESGTYLSLAGSFVSKHEKSEVIPVTEGEKKMQLNLPENVPAWGTRLSLQRGGMSIYGEYAYKYNDPTADNKFIYRDGSVAMLSASYSRSGMSALLQAKRSENFNYLSKRTVLGLPLHINYLPPFSQQQTYTLAALYPYATQPGGEWAFQGELRYTFKRKTLLGGKYGTQIRLNASHIRGIKQDWQDRNGKRINLKPGDEGFEEAIIGGNGYSTTFFGTGDLYFQDINFEISKKLSPSYSFTLTYINQRYNKDVIVGHKDDYDKENIAKGVAHPGMYHTNVFIYDGKHKLSNKLQLRTELQYLTTKQGEGDWIFVLAELSIQPGLMFTISDQYNAGLTKEHYYMASVAYAKGAHRIQLSGGRTREGINCSGGVCRLMPATQGVYISYNGSF